MSENPVERGMTESQIRTAFIELDVKAKKLGGIDQLPREHQMLYIQFGLEGGFLNEEEVREIADTLCIDWGGSRSSLRCAPSSGAM
jgi:hypothetical protein